MSKFMEFITMLNSHFYGEHWYIYWGIVFAIIAVAVGLNVPSFIKSIKSAKERNKTNVNIYSGKPGSGHSLHYNDYMGGKKKCMVIF